MLVMCQPLGYQLAMASLLGMRNYTNRLLARTFTVILCRRHRPQVLVQHSARYFLSLSTFVQYALVGEVKRFISCFAAFSPPVAGPDAQYLLCVGALCHAPWCRLGAAPGRQNRRVATHMAPSGLTVPFAPPAALARTVKIDSNHMFG